MIACQRHEHGMLDIMVKRAVRADPLKRNSDNQRDKFSIAVPRLEWIETDKRWAVNWRWRPKKFCPVTEFCAIGDTDGG